MKFRLHDHEFEITAEEAALHLASFILAVLVTVLLWALIIMLG